MSRRLAMKIQYPLYSCHKQTCGGDWVMPSAGVSRWLDPAHRCSAGIARAKTTKILLDVQPPTQLVETSSWPISRITAISPALLNQLKLTTDASKSISEQSS